MRITPIGLYYESFRISSSDYRSIELHSAVSNIKYRKLAKLLIPGYRRYYRYTQISKLNDGDWSWDYLTSEDALTQEQKLIMFYMIRGQGKHYIGNQLNNGGFSPFDHVIVEEMAWQALKTCAKERKNHGFIADFWSADWPFFRDDYVPSKAKAKQPS